MIKIELTENEVNALTQLMDLGVKSSGLGAVRAATVLLTKIEYAVAASKEPAKKEEENG